MLQMLQTIMGRRRQVGDPAIWELGDSEGFGEMELKVKAMMMIQWRMKNRNSGRSGLY